MRYQSLIWLVGYCAQRQKISCRRFLLKSAAPRPPSHDGLEDSGRTVFLWYVDSPQRSRMIPSLFEGRYRFSFLLWCIPCFAIYSWCPFALVFCHSLHGKGFATKRVGQQVLQGLDLAPSALLCCLHDTGLEPPHIAFDVMPAYGVPFSRFVGGCTRRTLHPSVSVWVGGCSHH